MVGTVYNVDRYFEEHYYPLGNGRHQWMSPFDKIKGKIAPNIDMADFQYKSDLTVNDFTWDYDEYWTDHDDKMVCVYRLPSEKEKQEIVGGNKKPSRMSITKGL